MRKQNTRPIQADSAALSDADGFVTAAIYLHADPDERVQTLRAIARARAALDRAMPGAVAGARAAGLSWEDIGRAVGLTRAAVWRKYSENSDRLDGSES